MNEVLHANIFFLITSVATVLFTILLCVALYHVIKILKSIRRIVERVDEGSEVIAEDIEHIRSFVLEGSLMSQIIRFFMGGGMMESTPTRKRTRKTKSKKED
ncbi:MAG: hypothetical protein AAGA35_04305 [Patescibacteria group bacterium]